MNYWYIDIYFLASVSLLLTSVQSYPNLWRSIQCLKQEENVIFHRVIQTRLNFPSSRSKTSTHVAARKSRQIQESLSLFRSKQRS